MGIPDAERLGTLPRVGVGLLSIVTELPPVGGGVCRDDVATDEMEFDLVGLAARTVAAGDAGGIENGLPEDEFCLVSAGAWRTVGVGTGMV